jgi:hypothetical protein
MVLAYERTDTVILEKGLLHLTNIPMVQLLQDTDLSCKRGLIAISSSSGAFDLMILYDLDGIPLACRTRHGLHDCRK